MKNINWTLNVKLHLTFEANAKPVTISGNIRVME